MAGRPPMTQNPMQVAQALRNPQALGMQAPAATPHNYGVPRGGSPIPMPSGGMAMPTAGIPMPDTQPRPYNPQGRMPIPKATPHNYGVPRGGAPIPMPSTATTMPVGTVPPRAY